MTETRQPLIEVEKLEAWYGRRRILNGIDFSVNAGEIRVIMGGSGSGKSTLLRHLLGLHVPRSGTVRLLGIDIANASEREMLALRRQIGVSFQGGALLTPGDIWQGIAKAFVFAVLICLIGISTGFSVSGGAEGVGRATTRAVVLSICYIIVADMIFSFFLNR